MDAVLKEILKELTKVRKALEKNSKDIIGGESMENEYSKAMKIIKKELKKDKSPGGIYYGWQSNIACCIMDNSDIEHDKANEIAIKFLSFLIR